jgi:hypothetical protein
VKLWGRSAKKTLSTGMCRHPFHSAPGVRNSTVSVYTYMRHVCVMCVTCEWRTNVTDNCSVGSATTSLISLMPVLRVGEHTPR